jgi:hypothetical protein
MINAKLACQKKLVDALHSINTRNQDFVQKWNLTDAMQRDVLQQAMYYLHQYASVYSLLDVVEPNASSSDPANQPTEACTFEAVEQE